MKTIIEALYHICSVRIDGVDVYRVVDYAPSSYDYEYGDAPGGGWDGECDRRIAEIRAALPEGWMAEWSDDDVIIERID